MTGILTTLYALSAGCLTIAAVLSVRAGAWWQAGTQWALFAALLTMRSISRTVDQWLKAKLTESEHQRDTAKAILDETTRQIAAGRVQITGELRDAVN
jgi:hypothetical protein